MRWAVAHLFLFMRNLEAGSRLTDGVEDKIDGLIREAVAAMGYDIVRVALTGGHSRPVLQIMIEPADGHDMTVDDCAAVSRAVSALLDETDPIGAAYSLEVTSPGIDRPLTRPKDYDRFAGLEARIETDKPIDGRKRFQGRLLGREGDRVRLALPAGEVSVAMSDIKRAKLVLTDELLAMTAAGRHKI